MYYTANVLSVSNEITLTITPRGRRTALEKCVLTVYPKGLCTLLYIQIKYVLRETLYAGEGWMDREGEGVGERTCLCLRARGRNERKMWPQWLTVCFYCRGCKSWTLQFINPTSTILLVSFFFFFFNANY